MTLRIDNMNWGILIANEDVDVYYEVTMQLFYGDSKPLSNKIMIPLVRDRANHLNEAL